MGMESDPRVPGPLDQGELPDLQGHRRRRDRARRARRVRRGDGVGADVRHHGTFANGIPFDQLPGVHEAREQPAAAQPRHPGPVRAGLDVQAVHARSLRSRDGDDRSELHLLRPRVRRLRDPRTASSRTPAARRTGSSTSPPRSPSRATRSSTRWGSSSGTRLDAGNEKAGLRHPGRRRETSASGPRPVSGLGEEARGRIPDGRVQGRRSTPRTPTPSRSNGCRATAPTSRSVRVTCS